MRECILLSAHLLYLARDSNLLCLLFRTLLRNFFPFSFLITFSVNLYTLLSILPFVIDVVVCLYK